MGLMMTIPTHLLVLVIFFSCLRDGVYSQDEGDLRLVDGTSTAGRVEIYHESRWGTIPHTSVRIYDISAVVCRQLGLPFTEAREITDVNVYGPGTGPVWVSLAFCDGYESRLTDCSNFMWKPSLSANYQSHDSDIAVSCEGEHIDYGEVRLVDGPDNQQGRLEIYMGTGWETFCDPGFKKEEATVACRQLGLASEAPAVYTNAYFGSGTGNVGPYILRCNGDETRIDECYDFYRSFTSDVLDEMLCGHSRDIGICCGSIEGDCKSLSSKKNSLIIKIVVPIVVILLLLCCCCCCCKKKKKTKEPQQYTAVPLNAPQRNLQAPRPGEDTTPGFSLANPTPPGQTAPGQQYPPQGYNPYPPPGGGVPPPVAAAGTPSPSQPYLYPSHPGQGPPPGGVYPSAPPQQGYYPTAAANPYPPQPSGAESYPNPSPYPSKADTGEGNGPSAPPMNTYYDDSPSMPPPSYDEVTTQT